MQIIDSSNVRCAYVFEDERGGEGGKLKENVKLCHSKMYVRMVVPFSCCYLHLPSMLPDYICVVWLKSLSKYKFLVEMEKGKWRRKLILQREN